MTISIPFDRTSRTKNPSVVLDDDLLNVIDLFRITENGEKPLSRSAAIRYLLQYAVALLTDERAMAEFVAEHTPAVNSALRQSD